MKFLALLFLVGFALVSAVPAPSHDLSVQEDELEQLLNFAFEADDDDVKTELGKKLREQMDELLEKLKDAVEQGKGVKEDLVNKMKELREKMKEMKIDFGSKAKELLEKIKEKAKDYWKKILDKLNPDARRERGIIDDMKKSMIEAFEKMLDSMMDTIENRHTVKDSFIRRMRTLCDRMKTFGIDIIQLISDWFKGVPPGESKDKMKEILDKMGIDMGEVDADDEILELREERSIKEVYEKIKNYFKELQIELKEKFTKFGEWAKGKYEKGLEKGKDKVENVKNLAKEFIRDAKVMAKDVAEQAKEFFREYKDDLGTIYDDVVKNVKEILSRND